MFWIFWRWKIWYFWAKELMEIWYLIFTDYWKVLVLNFSVMGNTISFLSQEVDGNMIFTGYWEVLVLNLLVMGNTVFFSAKKLMERWYLHDLFELSMIFQDLGNIVVPAVNIAHEHFYSQANYEFIFIPPDTKNKKNRSRFDSHG